MFKNRSLSQRVLAALTGLLIIKIIVSVVLKHRDYAPPNFQSDFLRGRESYFFGSYHWAFYVHIASGPISLSLGLLLISEQVRQHYPQMHRCLGRIQVSLVLLAVTPSGLWMAYFAAAGPISGAGLACLAVATAICTALGWRTAVKRRFLEHRQWMCRSFVLLCSAVVLRILGGLGSIVGFDAAWFDPLAAWVCWLLPLAALELSGFGRGSIRIPYTPIAAD